MKKLITRRAIISEEMIRQSVIQSIRMEGVNMTDERFDRIMNDKALRERLDDARRACEAERNT